MIDTVCRNDPEEAAGTLYFGCDPQFKGSQLDFERPLVHAELEVIRKTSCTSRYISASCRHFSFVVRFRFHDNATEILKDHLRLIHETSDSLNRRSLSDPIIDLPMDIQIGSSTENLLKMDVNFHFRLSGSLVEGIDETFTVSAFPQGFLFEHEREVAAPTMFEDKINLRLQKGQGWEWELPQFAVGIVSDPGRGQTNRSTVLELPIGVDIAEAPVGSSLYSLTLRIYHNEDLVETFDINVEVIVYQASVSINGNNLDVSRSMSEGAESKSVLAVNEGTHSAQWNAKLLATNGTELTNSTEFWAQLQHLDGEIPPSSAASPLVTVTFYPSNVYQTGEFQAWLLIETNSWETVSQDIPSSWNPPMDVVSDSENPIFWFPLNFLVTSLFVCDRNAGQQSTLQPFEHVKHNFDIVNTELNPVRVFPDNFRIRFGNMSMQNETKAQELTSSTRVEARRRFLTPWFSVTPISRVVFPGRSTTVVFQITYDSKNRTIMTENGPMDFRSVVSEEISVFFDFLIYFDNSQREVTDILTHKPDDIRHGHILMSFIPGSATVQDSFLNVSQQSAFVGEEISMFLHLVDHFGNEPARAVYTENEKNVVDTYTVPPLSIKLTEEEGQASLPGSVVLPSTMGEGQIAGSFVFRIRFFSIGKMKVDVQINGTSIRNSPQSVESEPVKCQRGNEIADTTGTKCVCQAGHYRETKSNECIRCEEGTFSGLPSNAKECEVCPTNHFSEAGSDSCYLCLMEGIDCSQGSLRLKEGHWCEECYNLEAVSNVTAYTRPRQVIVDHLKEDRTIPIHECRDTEACIVNSTTFQTTCQGNRSGPLCESCGEDHVLISKDHRCVSCDDYTTNLLMTIVSFSLLGGILLVLSYTYTEPLANECPPEHRRTSESNSDEKTANIPSQENGHRLSILDKTVTHEYKWAKGIGEIVIIYLDYLQMVSIINTSLIDQFKGISEWLGTITELSLFNPTRASPVKCITNSSAFENAVFTMALPWILMVLLMIIHIFMESCVRKTNLSPLRSVSNSVPAILVLFNLIHASVTDVVIESFRQYPEPLFSERRLSMDLSIEVGSFQQQVLLVMAVVTIALFVFGFPFGVATFLIRKFAIVSSISDTTAEFHRYKSLIEIFRLNRKGYVWPYIVIMRRAIILLVLVVSDKPFEQLVLVTSVLMASYVLLSILHPYQLIAITKIEQMKTYLVFANCCLGAIWLGISQNSLYGGMSGEKTSVEALVIVCQFAMLVAVITTALSMLSNVARDLRNFATKRYTDIRENLPSCKGRCPACGRANSSQVATSTQGKPRDSLQDVKDLDVDEVDEQECEEMDACGTLGEDFGNTGSPLTICEEGETREIAEENDLIQAFIEDEDDTDIERLDSKNGWTSKSQSQIGLTNAEGCLISPAQESLVDVNELDINA